MKFKHKMQTWLIGCIISCIMFPAIQPILVYAESMDTKLNVNGINTTLSVRPYINDLGLMVDARELVEAYGLEYQFDSDQKCFRIIDNTNGDIMLMHNATKFYSGKTQFQCDPYFYVENTIPMIEVGFFCTMFDSSYEYDEKTNTIFIQKGEIDKNIAKIKINDTISSMYYEPFKGEYGLMVGAEDIAKAFGLGYTFDLESGTAIMSDVQHGDVILKDGATTFQSGENVFECLPYFYLVNETPFIEIGFFCKMYGKDYQYDEETKTLTLFDKQEPLMLFSTNENSTVSGKISYTSEMVFDELPVQLVMRPYKTRYWSYLGNEYGEPQTLGTVTLTKNEVEQDYQFDLSSYSSDGYPYYEWYCIVQSEEAYAVKSHYDSFSYNEEEYADFEIAVHDISGTIELNKEILDEETIANGTDVNLILQQTAQRRRKYEPSYTVIGERHTLGTVRFAAHETSQDYVYAVFPYASEEYPNYSLFFDAPGIEKYGYYSVYNGTTSLDTEPNYNDKTYYYTTKAASFSFPGRKHADLKIGYNENLTGTLEIDSAASIPSDGLNVSFVLKTAESRRCAGYGHPYWDEGETYTLGTVHITQDSPKADFRFDTRKYSNDLNPFSILFYQIEDNSGNIGGYGYVSDCDKVTEIETQPENYHFNEDTHSAVQHTGMIITDDFNPLAFLSDRSVNIDLILPTQSIATSGSCGDSARWSFNVDTGELRISGTGVVESSPWDVYADSINSIYIEGGITDINPPPHYAPLNNLKEINVSTSNPEYASDDGVLLNKEKTEILYCPGGKTGSYVMPDSVTRIYYDAFSDCNNLTSITIGSGVTYIATSAFDECSSLKEINVSTNNPEYASDDGVLLNKEKTEILYCPKGKNGSYIIPDSVTSINHNYDAFSGCNGLTSITLGSGIEYIYDSMYTGLNGLDDCINLKEVKVSENNPYYTSDNGVVLSKDKTKLIYCPKGKSGSCVIPESVISIGSYAFSDCRDLNAIIIPDSVTSIGNYAFSDCSSLREIYVDKNNSHYTSDDGILWNKDETEIIYCSKTKAGSYTIPDGVTSISDYAFEDCMELTDVIIPDSVTSIGEAAFYNCYCLRNISIGDGVVNIGRNAFAGTEYYDNRANWNDMTLYIDNCLIGLEQKPDRSYQIADGTSVVGGGVFSGCSDLVNVTIPDSVIGISDSAFSGCSGLTSITIPDSVIGIGDYAFSNCRGLTNISIPNNVTSIGNGVFYGCSSLTSITIPDNVTNIGDYAFSDCSSLTSITIPESVTSIGNRAFSYCDELNEVYYSGSKDDWLQIAIGYGNGALTNATIYYNGDKPVLPAVVEITPSETDTEYIFTVTPIEVNDTCHVYGVAYSADGRMLDCDAKELETEGPTTVRIEKSDNIKSVKAFVWTDEMQPVALEEIELNE